MKRITRNRRLTPEEAAKYRTIREQVAEELPDMIARHHERIATLDQIQDLKEPEKPADDDDERTQWKRKKPAKKK